MGEFSFDRAANTLMKFGGNWDEDKHPRDHGKFAHSTGSSVAGIAAGAGALAAGAGAYMAARKGRFGQAAATAIRTGEKQAAGYANDGVVAAKDYAQRGAGAVSDYAQRGASAISEGGRSAVNHAQQGASAVRDFAQRGANKVSDFVSRNVSSGRQQAEQFADRAGGQMRSQGQHIQNRANIAQRQFNVGASRGARGAAVPSGPAYGAGETYGKVRSGFNGAMNRFRG